MNDAKEEAMLNAVEFFEERAAILAFDGGLRRVNAESVALQETAARYGKPGAKRADDWRKSKINSRESVNR